MGNEFFVTHENGDIQKGLYWGVENPKAVLVMATGMQEYAQRYERFAKFLNENSFDVYCLDAYGQGLNVSKVEDLQKWPEKGFVKCVDGIALTVKEARKKNLPTYVFGHSMGSFMIQSLLERYPGIADKYVICGSNGPNKVLYSIASLLAKIVSNKKNWDEPSPLLSNLAMGGYSKAFKNRNTDLDWLSEDIDNVNKYIKDDYCGHTNTNGFWNGFLSGMADLYKKSNLKKINKDSKILIISGANDPVGNMAKGVRLLDKMYKDLGVKDVNCIIYENMRHEILNEKEYMKVFNDILCFLNK